jgi:hypothetical protein
METCIICTLEKKLTDEHIIPEFMGGGLIVKNVCKECNSKMGSGFEGRISNNFIYQATRYFNKIEGKSLPPFPFKGVRKDERSGRNFSIAEDGSLTSIPSITLKDNQNGVSISLSVDKKDINKIKPLIEKKLSRLFKAKGESVSSSKISEGVDRFLSQSEHMEHEIKNPSITQSISIDFNDIELLHIKIAYELACYHFGSDYITDPVANSLRLSLFNLSIGVDIKAQTPMEDNSFEAFIDDAHHWVIYMLGGCYVSAFGFNSFINFASEGSPFVSTEGVVYRFCYKSRTFSNNNLQGMLSDRRA